MMRMKEREKGLRIGINKRRLLLQKEEFSDRRSIEPVQSDITPFNRNLIKVFVAGFDSPKIITPFLSSSCLDNT
jgi:hypothetical protein